MGEEDGDEGVVRQEAGQRSSVGVVLGGEEPNRLSPGETWSPK